MRGRLPAVTALVDLGASLYAADGNGRTVFDALDDAPLKVTTCLRRSPITGVLISTLLRSLLTSFSPFRPHLSALPGPQRKRRGRRRR